MLRQVQVEGGIPVSVKTKPSEGDQGQTPSSDCPTLHLHGAEDEGEAQIQAGHRRQGLLNHPQP